MEIFKLFGSVMVDTDKANESLQKTDKNASNVGETLAKGAKGAAVFAAGVATAAASAVAGMVNVAMKTAETTDNIDKMSQRLGITRESFQELDFVLSQSGVDINSFQTGMKSLLKNMDAVSEGNATATENFEKLGVAVTNADGSLRSQEDVLFDAIAAFQGMEDSAEKSRLAQELFGKQGQEILPLLNAESGSLEEMRQQAHDLGLVLSDETIDAGVSLTDTIDKLKRSFEAVGANLGSVLMPIVEQGAEMLISFMPTLKEIIDRIGPTLESLFNSLLPILFDLVQQVLPPLLELVDALLPLFETLCELILPLITKLLTALVKVLIDYVIPAIKKVVEAVKNIIDKVPGAFTKMKNTIVNTFEAIKNGIKAPINGVIGMINRMINALNALSFDVPSWVPVLGGKSFGFNLSNIPMLAEGGQINGSGQAIVGESGAELIDLPQGARVTPLNDNNNAFVGMEKQLEALQEGFNNLAAAIMGYRPQIVLDSGVLVGGIAKKMDDELGNLALKELRGVY